MAGTLVVFYSRKGENHMPGGIQVLEKGNTAYAAEYIAQAVGADIFERGLCLPSDNKMTKEEQNTIIELIKDCFR